MSQPKDSDGMTLFREKSMTANAYLLCTPAGRVRYASSPLRLMLEEDLTGRNLNDFLEDATAARLIAETLAGKCYAFRCELREQAFNCRAEPWEEGDGIQIGLFPVNGGKPKTVAAGVARFMAREIDRELGVLLPAVCMLQDNARPEQEAVTAMMLMHLHRLLRMSRNVEELALVENGALKLSYSEVDLTAFCRELLEKVEPYCKAWKIVLHNRLPEEAVVCRVDKEKVQRMLLHLITNAIAAQKEGGTVSVSLQQRENGDVVLSVADSGCGMGSGIFQDVNRTIGREDLLNPGGLGLGLELTRAFAEAHGGQMMLMSSENGGLVVRLTLPRGEQAELDELHNWSMSYGTGIDPVAVDLSPVAKKELYLKK